MDDTDDDRVPRTVFDDPAVLDDPEVTGRVTAVNDATLSVEGIAIAWTDATRLVNGLSSRADVEVGNRVEVEVRRIDGTLNAHEVVDNVAESIAELEAIVDAKTASTLTLLGVTLDVTGQTEFYAPFRELSNVSVGDAVEVEFRRTDAGWVAVEVEPYSSSN
jgi:uncharacterized OB-fold protein